MKETEKDVKRTIAPAKPSKAKPVKAGAPTKPAKTAKPASRKPAAKKIAFALVAPEAKSVSLVGDFTGWDQQPIPMKQEKDGWWKATIALPPGSHEYRFLVDGEWRNDPECSTFSPNAFGSANCVRQV